MKNFTKKQWMTIIGIVLMAVVLLAINKIDRPVKSYAEETEYKTLYVPNEKGDLIYRLMEFNEELNDWYEEEEIKNASHSISYKEIEKGIYDCKFIFTMEQDSYEFHVIYDSIEEEELSVYGVRYGIRIDHEDLEDLAIHEHPEFESLF